jgi:ryanodine receptor 2
MREEQNFISANEIDNMVLIMPTATRRSAVVSEGGPVAGGSKVSWTYNEMLSS